MRKIYSACLLLLVSLLVFCPSRGQERYSANWDTLKKYQTPDWFRDAKFGIFIHWGVYSVPAFGSEWYPHEMYQKGSKAYQHHIDTYGPHSKFGYKDFIPMFKAENFDAAKWIGLFKKAGARYIVPVAEHHDGFAMYRTALSKWNAAEMGPKKDIIGALAEETRRQGLVFGLSSHRIEHWFFMGGGRHFDSDVMSGKYDDFYGPAREESETPTPEFMNDWLLRNVELIDKYHPQLFWFDWWIGEPAMDPYRKSFASYYYNKALEWKQGVVINYKYTAYKDGSAVLDLERGKLGGIRELPWQTDDALGNESWGYAMGNTFKTSQYIITNLVDIVSKNGNLLLNVGPRPDGTITDEETKVLLETGKWLDVNGEAIYATRPWKLSGEGPTESANGAFADQKKPFMVKDIRFTTRDGALYAITLGVPTEAVTIKALALGAGNGKVSAVGLVGSTVKLKWVQRAEGLVIQPAGSYPSENAVAFKILLGQ